MAQVGAAAASLNQFACDPSPPVYGKDFSLLLYWDRVPDSARIQVFDPSGASKLNKVFESPAELTFPADIYTRHLTTPGTYRVQITPIEGEQNGQTTAYSIDLQKASPPATKANFASQEKPLTPPRISQVIITPRDTIYKGDELRIEVVTVPPESRVEVEILAPKGHVDPFGYQQLGEASATHVVTKNANFDESGDYTVRCVARNEAGESKAVEKQIKFLNYTRSERGANLKIVRVVPSNIHAGDDVIVTLDTSDPTADVSYAIGKRNSSEWMPIGDGKGKEFKFTAGASQGLDQSGPYLIRAEIKTAGGRLLQDDQSIQYTRTPQVTLRPLAPPSAAIAVSPGGMNNVTIEAENKGNFPFAGMLQIRGPSGFKYTLDDSTAPDKENRWSLAIPAKDRKVLNLSIDVGKDYDRGQHKDLMGQAMGMIQGGLSRAQNASPGDMNPAGELLVGDNLTVDLLDDQGKKTGGDLAYSVKSSGEVRNGQLVVSVSVDPGFFADLSHLRPKTQYIAQFTVYNKGGTLMFINGVDFQVPKCVTVLPGSRVVTKPKPWKTSDPGFGLCESLMDVLASSADAGAKALAAVGEVVKDKAKDMARDAAGTVHPQGPATVDMADHVSGFDSRIGRTEQVVGAVADLFMTKYFMQFLQVSKVGYPMPRGERMVFEVPFVTGETGSGTFSLSVNYSDLGSDPKYDFGSGYSVSVATVQQWEKDFLTQDYAPVGARAQQSLPITIETPPFDKAVQGIVTPLQQAGADIGNMVNGAVGYVAKMKCPADLHIYDAQGRHTGKNYQTGEYDLEIPNAQHMAIGEADYIYVPESIGNYRVETVGRDTGTYNLDILTPVFVWRSGDFFERVLVPIEYSNVTVTAGQKTRYGDEALRISKLASAGGLDSDWTANLQGALHAITHPNSTSQAVAKPRHVGSLVSVIVAFVAMTGFLVLRRTYG